MSCSNCGTITLFKGEDGRTLLNGSGVPGAGLGNNGDFYIDTNAWEIYGPKTGGAWGTGTSLIGPQGLTGVGIASVAWTSNSEGGSQGDPGTTDTYTITYTDASTDTFIVYNGDDGIDLYDSGWVEIPDWNGEFGLPSLTNWNNPKIRVIGRHVYVSGNFMLPLATAASPGVLLPNVSTYPTTYKNEVHIFTGTDGGFAPNPAGSLTSNNPILPTELLPNETHNIDRQEIVYRSVQSSASENINLTTVLSTIDLKTDGKLLIATWKDALDSAGGLSITENTPLSKFIMQVDAGASILDYSNWKEQFSGSTTNYPIKDLGSGYTNGTHTGVTTTALTGSGIGLTLDVTISGGKLVSVAVNAAGSGYANGDIVSIDASTGTPGIGAGSDAVITIEITNTDDRITAKGIGTYPATFDGMNERSLGGFFIPFTFNYPLNENVTEAQIQAAIALL